MILWLGLAFAIGGEKYFGKWKRGMLVYPAVAFIGWGLHWTYFPVQLLMTYIIYQSLRYDECIDMIYGTKGNWLANIGLAVNGAFIGLHPMVYYFYKQEYALGIQAVLFMAIAFPICVWIGNVYDFKIPVCKRVFGVGWFCPKDMWWLVSFLTGIMLGLTFSF